MDHCYTAFDQLIALCQESTELERYIEAIVEQDFLTTEMPTAEMDRWMTENFYFLDQLKQCSSAIKLLTEKRTDIEEFWKHITGVRNVLGIFYYIMDSVKQNAKSAAHLESAALSSQIYLQMMMIPGHRSREIFNSVIYLRCLQTLYNLAKYHSLSESRAGSQQSSGRSGSQTRSGSRGRKRRLNSQISQDCSQDDNQIQLDDNQCDLLYMTTVQSLRVVVEYARTNHIRSFPENIESTIDILVKLLPCDHITNPSVISCIRFEHTQNEYKLNTITQLSLLIISTLCINHTVSMCSIKQTFKELKSYLLMTHKKITTSNIPREMVALRDLSLQFLLYIIKEAGEIIQPTLQRLISVLIMQTPDKSEYRSKSVQMLSRLLDETSNQHYCNLIKYIFTLTKSNQVSHRVMSVELIGSLIINKELRNLDNSGLDSLLTQYINRCVLLQAVLVRCSDKSHIVIAKALGVLSQCLNSDQLLCDIRQFITPRTTARRQEKRVYTNSLTIPLYQCATGETQTDSHLSKRLSSAQSDNINTIQTASSQEGITRQSLSTVRQTEHTTNIFITKGFDITLADSEGLISMIERRIKTPKVSVRKSALSALDAVIRYNDCDRMNQEVNVISEHCRDRAILIRKQAIQVLTELLLKYPDKQYVQNAWLHGVLPAIRDNEGSVQTKAAELISQTLFYKLEHEGDLGYWLLNRIDGSQHSLLSDCCLILHKQKMLPDNIINLLIQHTNSIYKKESWSLLSMLCGSQDKLNARISSFISDYWFNNNSILDAEICNYVLDCISMLASGIKDEVKKRLQTDLLSRIRKYTDMDSIRHVVSACNSVSDNLTWAETVLLEVEQKLEHIKSTTQYGATGAEDRVEYNNLPLYLITLAETAVFKPKISDRIFYILKSLIIKPGENMEVALLITELQTNTSWTKLVKRTAFFALCQMCIGNKEQTIQCVPILAHELETNTDSTIRQILVLTLCDMCKLYTNIIGPYVSCLSSSLKDECVLVRKTAFVAITRLLQEDFLKWKGSLFYRLISVVNDQDQELSQLAKQCFVHELLRRCNTMFSQHFVECVFHFNNYQNHKTYNRFKQTDSEMKLFSLEGPENKEHRLNMFKFMLTNMVDTQKFSCTQKLCKDVLSSLVEKELPLNDDKIVSVLSDTLDMLSSQEIKIQIDKSSNSGDIEDEPCDSQPQTNKVRAVATAAVNALLRHNFIELVIPDILALKHMLGQMKSPVVRNLMMFLIEIMKDYKTEMADVLSANPQLAAEIEFDKRKFEEQLVQEKIITEQDQTNLTIRAETPEKQPSTSETPLTKTPVQLNQPLPPPPPRSALKRQPLQGAQVIQQTAMILEESRQEVIKTPGKRVNFHQHSDSDSDEEQGHVILPEASQTPRFTGARAISTPGGRIDNITFAGSTSLHSTMSPIVLLADISGLLTEGFKHDLDHLTAANWNIKSPRAKEVRKSDKQREITAEPAPPQTNISLDPLSSARVNQSTQRPNTRQKQPEKPANKQKETVISPTGRNTRKRNHR